MTHDTALWLIGLLLLVAGVFWLAHKAVTAWQKWKERG